MGNNLWGECQEWRQETALLPPAAAPLLLLLQLPGGAAALQLQVQVAAGVQVRVQLLKVVARRLPASEHEDK